MKVIHLSTYKSSGGASIAALRLHQSMLRYGIKSEFYSRDNPMNNETRNLYHKIILRFYKKFYQILDSIPRRIYKNLNGPFSPNIISSVNVPKVIEDFNPDVIILHWITDGFLNVRDLLVVQKPILWILHDSWAFTGGCHVPQSCTRYKRTCGSCPVLGSNLEIDLSYKIFEKKKRIYAKMNLQVVAPSKWIYKNVQSSSLLKTKEAFNIPNTLDERKFKPSHYADRNINLIKEKKYVLFIAINADKDPNKGLLILQNAASLLDTNTIILVVGTQEIIAPKNLISRFKYLGHISDEKKLISLYNSVELTVVPSLQENLPNTILESLACGTPVVSFNVGGNPDLIDHKINGYLAHPYSEEDLANGIIWVLSQKQHFITKKMVRESFLEKFHSKLVVEKYLEVLKNVIQPIKEDKPH
jgi:glycosyltransferase involved in cell wall biosynthesis